MRRHFVLFWAGLLATVFATAAGAQEPYLVKNINPGSSSDPDFFIDINGVLFFTADDGTHGAELWKSDGSAVNTTLVADINPNGDSTPEFFVNMNGVAYFVADDDTTGKELWRSDGFTTNLVKDINLNGDSEPTDMTVIGNTLYFAATDSNDDRELWKSDGTEAGTVMVKDIAVGTQDASEPEHFAVLAGVLYFAASDAAGDRELWKSNGTSAGTTLVRNIDTGGSSNPEYLTTVGNTIFFQADINASGHELWKTNGTSTGTVLVKDINPGAADSAPEELTRIGNALYFSATDGVTGRELWKSNGTAAGTLLVKDINPAGDSLPDELTEVGGRLFFRASYDGTPAMVELYTSGGNPDGSDTLLLDINPSGTPFPDDFVDFYGVLYLAADDGTHGNELWRSDGTPEGTELVFDLAPGYEGSSPEHMLVMGGDLYFKASDGSPIEDELYAFGGDAPHLGTISARGKAASGNNALISGFTVLGGYKRILIRALGPSLTSTGLTSGLLSDPNLQVFAGSTRIGLNDNWGTAQAAEILATGLAPANVKESAIILVLPEGTYTAVVAPTGKKTGISQIEVYDLE